MSLWNQLYHLYGIVAVPLALIALSIGMLGMFFGLVPMMVFLKVLGVKL